jgi:hypothetical protein
MALGPRLPDLRFSPCGAMQHLRTDVASRLLCFTEGWDGAPYHSVCPAKQHPKTGRIHTPGTSTENVSAPCPRPLPLLPLLRLPTPRGPQNTSAEPSERHIVQTIMYSLFASISVSITASQERVSSKIAVEQGSTPWRRSGARTLVRAPSFFDWGDGGVLLLKRYAEGAPGKVGGM